MEPCDKCETCTKLCEIVPQMVTTFKALGDQTRLQIIYLLATDTSGALGVSELAVRLGVSQPAVSQHLKTLRGEGLVESRRDGFYIYYSLNRDRIQQFRKHFELMYSCVMDKCNRELMRTSTRDRPIKACVIFYSYSGVTRRVAEGIRAASGCDSVEVRTKTPYSNFTAYTKGVLRSRKMACDPIEPERIDVSAYDLIIIGTPVWAWHPAPAMNAAVQALSGCEGKMAVTFVTCSNQPGEALAVLKKALEERGLKVMAQVSLDQEDTKNPDAGGELLQRIIEATPLDETGDGKNGEGKGSEKKGEQV